MKFCLDEKNHPSFPKHICFVMKYHQRDNLFCCFSLRGKGGTIYWTMTIERSSFKQKGN